MGGECVVDDPVDEARILAARPDLSLVQRPVRADAGGDQQVVEVDQLAVTGQQLAVGTVDGGDAVRHPIGGELGGQVGDDQAQLDVRTETLA